MTRPRRIAMAGLVLGLAAVAAGPAAAQDLAAALADGSLANRALQLVVLVGLISFVPGLLVMVTCFPFIITVLSVLRQAIGLQQAPPNMLLVSLALFLTWFVMEPVFLASWANGVSPWLDGSLAVEEAFAPAAAPFRAFMAARVDAGTLSTIAGFRPDVGSLADPSAVPLSVLVPSFLLSEIQRAFLVGFLVFIPFLVIDLVVAAVLMSMGMMMVPPAIVALPFKLAFFVVVDGWTLVTMGLVEGYAAASALQVPP
jgi:flagellar biosynthetic protein FliP